VASRENLFKLSGINLSVEDMILVFSGNPPRLAPINSEWGFPLAENQLYYLERIAIARNTIQRIWFDVPRQTISHFREYMLTNGELVLAVTFEDYLAEQGAYPIPRRILIDRPLDRTQVEISYTSFDVNRLIEDRTVFRFMPPSNAKSLFIDDTSAEQLERLAPYEDFRTEEEL
jgi:hypothetical protein